MHVLYVLASTWSLWIMQLCWIPNTPRQLVSKWNRMKKCTFLRKKSRPAGLHHFSRESVHQYSLYALCLPSACTRKSILSQTNYEKWQRGCRLCLFSSKWQKIYYVYSEQKVICCTLGNALLTRHQAKETKSWEWTKFFWGVYLKWSCWNSKEDNPQRNKVFQLAAQLDSFLLLDIKNLLHVVRKKNPLVYFSIQVCLIFLDLHVSDKQHNKTLFFQEFNLLKWLVSNFAESGRSWTGFFLWVPFMQDLQLHLWVKDRKTQPNGRKLNKRRIISQVHSQRELLILYKLMDMFSPIQAISFNYPKARLIENHFGLLVQLNIKYNWFQSKFHHRKEPLLAFYVEKHSSFKAVYRL